MRYDRQLVPRLRRQLVSVRRPRWRCAMTADLSSTAALDSPVAEVEARSILLAASSRSHSVSDRLAYRMDADLLAHPERCSTDATYPWWTPAMGCCPAHNQGGAA